MPKPQVNIAPSRENTRVITGCIRLAYQALTEPKISDLADADKTPKYIAVLLFEPSDPTVALMKQAMQEAALDFFGAEKLKIFGPTLRNPLRNGAEKAAEYPFYADHLFLNCNTKHKPGLVDQRNKPITDADEIYSGCWVRVELNAYGYDKKGNKGVSFGLNNVQKLGDDERFGGRRPADQVFSPVVDAASPFGNGEATAAASDSIFG